MVTLTGPATPVPAEVAVHLRRARDHADAHFTEPLTLADLAAVAGYSPHHFARAFSRAFGTSPIAYLATRRVERAKDLLRSANLTVTEVCHAVGFTSLGTFSARFTAIVGVTPTAYRAEHVRRGGPPPVPGCFALAWGRPQPAAPPAAAPGDRTTPAPTPSDATARSEKPQHGTAP
ncbi:helix-turn-helix transcriptional regulator [Cellulosimicrobium cellulans]|uniref:helix-turn-helix transcriptional regulator n=1 Tax=Cellulosimicrobium cellulans TaxID=1710 RepID=UPI0008485BAC|nr:AraC family transcriptional regulator [Cellulosimicrobium cellulans]